ncbi:quinoprotein glucose dehydrogenase [Bacillus sp. FJAT-18019]|uniref:Quinoprotein glucose dehydrogenase n=1 Tax=Paenibacillus solani TaxID=1705565 RepID=A0A0M1P688_9BACL|nr:PQQ-dependent sugar dehydrogenase [Paenibacillus solani]KOP67842.1 quinoprotein glucose dehydrogenase [Bacillus sp. FJAT-18019]KOR89815.1 quinoprotein glucose dehydrogenase [Paenibacillus solani]
MKRMKFGASVIAALLLLVACTQPTPSKEEGRQEERQEKQTNPAYQVVAEQLRTPWSIDFDGATIYVSEREGNIVQIKNGVLTRQSLHTNKPVAQIGEGGFLGFALAPDFQDSGNAFAYHTYEQGEKLMNRLVLLKQEGNQWRESKVLLERIPGSNVHNGGRISIGPDKMLYVTTGDSGEEELAQNQESLAGKILRLTQDGKVPADNPNAGSYVFTLGHRNSQGMAWNSKGEMYSSEHGPSGTPGGHDEINKIRAGSNYGWPEIIGDEQQEGMKSPIYHSSETAIAPSGIAFDEKDHLYVATLRGQKLYEFQPENDSLKVVMEGEGRLRDVKIHNGRIYVITNNTDGRGVPSDQDDRLLVLESFH